MKRLITIILPLLILNGVQLKAADHFVILQYHHFGTNTPASTSISPDQFESHLTYLEKNHFQILPFSRALNAINSGQSLPDKSIVITIDDAYLSIYQEAYPRLKKRGWPFTVFVASQPVDKGYKNFMNWQQMREMQKNGGTFAAHSQTHAYLVRRKSSMSVHQWQKWVKDEILTSINRLETELGKTPRLFAYPFGEYDSDLKKIVLSLGLTGVGQHSGAAWRGSDSGALPRFPMSGIYADLKQFRLKVSTLPLPVVEQIPDNPVLTTNNRKPSLQLRLDPGEYDINRLTCFASGQGRIKIDWIDRSNRIFNVTPNKPLPYGRSRYNCTAPHKSSKRYFWYSLQWLRLKL